MTFEEYENSINDIDGMLVSGQERWLYEQARALPDGATIVEIGAYKGRSTVALGYGCLNSNKHIYCIDTFDGNVSDFKGPGRCGFYGEWEANITKNGLRSYVTPIIGFSQEVVRDWNRPMDFIFIDGSHVYEDVLADFDGFYPHLKPGGVLAMHDVGNPGHPGCLRVWEECGLKLLVNVGYCSTIAYGYKPPADV